MSREDDQVERLTGDSKHLIFHGEKDKVCEWCKGGDNPYGQGKVKKQSGGYYHDACSLTSSSLDKELSEETDEKLSIKEFLWTVRNIRRK